MDSIAYEMGAVFLLAAMLMFGSAHGFIPRSLRNAGAPIAVGAILLGFLIWRFGPDLYETARSSAAPWLAAPEPPSREPASSQPALAEPVPPGKVAAPRPKKSAPENVQTIVIREVPEPPEPAPPLVQPIVETLPAEKPAAEKPAVEKPFGGKQLAANPIEEADAQPAAEPSGSSPYDSGLKRAVKSVGRFLHIGRKKEPAPQ